MAPPPEAAVSATAGPMQPIAIPAPAPSGAMTTPRPGSARRPSRFSDQAERTSPGQRSPSTKSDRPPSAPSARMADRPPSGSKRRASESEPAPLDAEGAGAAGQRAAVAGGGGVSGVPRMQVPQPALPLLHGTAGAAGQRLVVVRASSEAPARRCHVHIAGRAWARLAVVLACLAAACCGGMLSPRRAQLLSMPCSFTYVFCWASSTRKQEICCCSKASQPL